MSTKKMVKCPHCSKRLSRQGLNGHLRFVHGVGAADVRATMKHGTVEDRAGRVLELMRRLKEIRAQSTELKKDRESFDTWWAEDRGKNAANAAFAKAFENLEAEILEELRNLGLLDKAE
jgi:hypothetical protein